MSDDDVDQTDRATDEVDDRLGAAVRQLTGRAERRALEIGDSVLRHVMAAPRRSLPVRSRLPDVFLSEHVVTDDLSRGLAQQLDTAAVRRISVITNRDLVIEQIAIELIGRYGTDLVAATEQARLAARDRLADLVGPAAPPAHVTVTHVHVGDVTVGDPRLVEPFEEE